MYIVYSMYTVSGTCKWTVQQWNKNPTLSRRMVSSALVFFPTNFWALNSVLELHSTYTNIRCLMICVIGWGSMCITFQIKGHKKLLTASSDPQGHHWHSCLQMPVNREAAAVNTTRKWMSVELALVCRQGAKTTHLNLWTIQLKAADVSKVNLHSAFWAPSKQDPASLSHLRSCGDGSTHTGSSCFQLQSTTESQCTNRLPCYSTENKGLLTEKALLLSKESLFRHQACGHSCANALVLCLLLHWENWILKVKAD